MPNLTPEEKERRRQERRQKRWNETHKLIGGTDHKICTTCKEWFPCNSDNFYVNNKILPNQDYYFIVHPKNEYNETGKYELHTLNSEEAIMVGYWKIVKALIRQRIIDKFLY